MDVYGPMHIGIRAVTAPLANGRRLKWEGRWSEGAGGAKTPLPDRLYDLLADPGEDHDLLSGKSPAPADAEAARGMAKLAEEWTAPMK